MNGAKWDGMGMILFESEMERQRQWLVDLNSDKGVCLRGSWEDGLEEVPGKPGFRRRPPNRRNPRYVAMAVEESIHKSAWQRLLRWVRGSS